MTLEERQALRKKHRDNGIDGRCETCHYDTPIEGLNDISVCTAPPYPCDVIKALDAWEAEHERILGVVDEEMRSSLKITVINAILRDVE